MSSSGLRTLGIILVVLGLIALVVGIVYLTVSVSSLPSFLGHAASSRHHTKRGWAGVFGGIVLLIIGVYQLRSARTARS